MQNACVGGLDAHSEIDGRSCQIQQGGSFVLWVQSLARIDELKIDCGNVIDAAEGRTVVASRIGEGGRFGWEVSEKAAGGLRLESAWCCLEQVSCTCRLNLAFRLRRV